MSNRKKFQGLPFWDRFHAQYKQADGCWDWIGSVSDHGYGKLMRGGGDTRPVLAHRAAYEYAFGAIPDGMWVLHHCDNPRCVKPSHLHLGTAKDNSAEMVARGRSCVGDANPSRRHPELLARGSRHPRPMAKLSENDVESIRKMRSSGIPQKEIARSFNVSPSTISLICLNRRWRHIA